METPSQLKAKCILLFGEKYGNKLFKELTNHFAEQHIYCSVSQSTSDNPVITYQRNDTGIEITATRSGSGLYVLSHPMFPQELSKLSHIVNAYDTKENQGIVKTQHKLGAGSSSTIFVSTALIATPNTNEDDVLEHTPFHIVIFQ